MQKKLITEEDLISISPLLDMRSQQYRAPTQPLHTLAQEPPHYDTQTELAPIHDFMQKLLQPDVIDRLKAYAYWQAQWRQQYKNNVPLETALEDAPMFAPLSINLDATTTCNYRCDHCVDMDILNTNIRYDHDLLKDSLNNLIASGLRSVIIIGGGEPTAYPHFENLVEYLKKRNIQIGIVTNGSLMRKIETIGDLLTPKDWVRLSLDSAINETFYAMHKPNNKKCTLDWICEHIPPIKDKSPNFQIGYSFIIVWDNCETNNANITQNIDEIYTAAERAKQYRFDYISYKPFLLRAESNNAEIVELSQDQTRAESVSDTIRRHIDRAKTLEDKTFKVIESTNLKVFENNSYKEYTRQPHNCHMQFFRQVLSPLGIFNCPVYRHVPQALLGSKHAYSSRDGQHETCKNTLRLIESFDAAEECKEVTCLYNHANWFIEDLIQNPEKIKQLQAMENRNDFFL